MSAGTAARGLILALLSLAPASAGGQPGPAPLAPDAAVTVSLEPPAATARVGDPFEIIAHVTLAGGARGPWMLAPTSDGPAIQVVRGRLLSIDADSQDERGARVRIPVLARAAGTTVLRARVSAYACADRRCRPIQAEGSIVLEVRAER